MPSKSRRFIFSNPNSNHTRAQARQRTHVSITPISLMWPGEVLQPAHTPMSWEADLGLNELVHALSDDRRYMPFIWHTLAALVTDVEVIRWRQAVMADLVRNHDLVARIEGIMPRLADLREGHALLGHRRRNLLLDTSDRLAELEVYTSVVQDLYDGLNAAAIESPALTTLRDHLGVLLGDENFKALCAELPDLRAPLENIASLTIGINLDTQLQPVSAVLMTINDYKLGEVASLLDKLIGVRTDEDGETGIAALHRLPHDPDLRVLDPFFQDLDKVLTQVAQPISRALTRYVKTNSRPLVSLENELAFYLAAVRLMRKLEERGVCFCQPEIAPMEERSAVIHDLVNISLALRMTPVASGVEIGEEGRIAILTGPNSGGKTTYVQGVGLAQAMSQAGMFIPARQARISPVDRILTHFPALETRQQGRLAEEAERLRAIFQQATPHSLVLLNETFSSTSFGEALYLAQDILAGLRAIGLRAIYATHLVELVERIDEIEQTPGESTLFSLVAGIRMNEDGPVTPTFQITRGLPLGKSFAREIARRHGISLEQILKGRGASS